MTERRRPGLLLFAGWLALIALHLWVARDVTTPGAGPGDQWGYLGSARYLAGDPHTYVMPFFAYFTYGYSVVLAPLVRLFDDPDDLFLAIKVVNAALAATMLPLLYLFARCVLAARRSAALAAAAIGSLVPALMAHPAAILAENLVLPLVVATLLACWLFLTERPSWQRLLFAPAMVWLHVTHNRFAASLLLFFTFLALVGLIRAVPRVIVAANAGVAVVALAAAQLLRNAIVEARWIGGIFTPQGPASDAVDVLTDRHLLGEYLLVCVGQLWYLAVTTFGLALVGLGATALRAVRRRDDGEPRLLADPERLTLVFLAGMAAAVFATSAYFFTRVVNGSEGFVVGRHNDSFVAVWVASAVVFLMAPTPMRRVRVATFGALATTLVLTGVLFAGRRGGDLGSLYSILNVPGLSPWGNIGDVVPQRAAVAAVAAITVAAVLTLLRVRPVVLLPLAALWWVVGASADVEPDGLRGWDVPDQIEALSVDRAAIFLDHQRGVPVYYQAYLPEVEVVPWDGTGTPPEPYVLAPLDIGLEAQGARVAVVDAPVRLALRPAYSVALWVLPGEEQDRLDEQGQLLPPGYPTTIPTEARVAELAWAPPRDQVATDLTGASSDALTLELDAGAEAPLVIHGRHAGEVTPWPDAGSVGSDVRVHLAVQAPPGPAPLAATTSAELPELVRPGEPFRSVATVAAVDAAGVPLPPGRYELAVEVRQGSGPAFALVGDALRLTLVVR